MFQPPQTGANVIGALGMTFSVINLIGSLAVGSFYAIIVALVYVVVFAGLMVARSTRNGLFYMPYLILHGIP
ncbi:hypothetical protein AAVH_07405 [Aphelenchoides avenae]|nr:hypothetical protein AAVH_07405 [Aphelenchus avenae]